MVRSPRPSSMAKRHLIDPTTHHTPWSVDVVSLVPKGVVDPSSGTPVAGAIHGKWACSAFSSGFFYVWQIKTTTLNEPLETPKEFTKFFLPDFATARGETISKASKPLVALTPSQGDNDSINLYILHPITGKMILKKISRRDLQQSGAMSHSHHHSTSTRIADPMLGDDETTLEEGETFQSLACKNSLVVATTSRGQLFLVTHTAVPFGLHVQKVEATQSGFLSRFFGSGPAVAGSGTTHVLPLSSTKFLALSKDSGIVEWNVEQKIAAGHHADFHPMVRLENFANALREQSWKLVSIQKVAMSVDGRFFHAIVEGNFEGETRLYWVVFDASTGNLLRSHWLSRFALPNQVETLGLVACETDAAYASFMAGESVILMVLLGEDEDFIQEVDLPPVEVPGVLPGMLSRDMVTHGCFLVAKSGIALRSRYMPQESTSPSKRARLEVRSCSDHVPVQTLVSHLRSHFWESYKNPTVDRPMPPSLLQSESNRERAIINVAVELQRKGVSGSPSIAMEWHEAFVKMVLDGGLYRCLSEESKWRMFAVGQEICVCKEIADALEHKHKHADVDWNESLQPYDLGGWFLKIQASEEASGWQNIAVWHDILRLACDTFWKFREEMADGMYDTLSQHGPVSWISHPDMQNLLRRQLSIFKAEPASASPVLVEVVVKTALYSFHETWYAAKDDEGRKEDFAKMQKTCISLLRLTNGGNDETAFDLCIQYEYFEGLCEIGLSHERKLDAKSYSLDPLFNSIKGCDLLNDLTFPQFVLQCHADRRLYGHVINYGRNCIGDLNLIMERNDNLRQYRWISSIRQGHFDQATKLCLENCEESKDIDKMQWNLSFAKLSNKLVASQNQQVLNRQKDIENNLDLVEAQQLLVGESSKADMDILLPPEKLIDLALNKLVDAYDMDDRVKFALIALAVCSNVNDESVVFEYTSKVWSECLLLNGAQWTEWAAYGIGDNFENVREEALTETVFGNLLNECRKDCSLAKVTYGRHIETEVIDRVQGDENRESFTRLLRTVATPTDTVVGKSMMVSSF